MWSVTVIGGEDKSSLLSSEITSIISGQMQFTFNKILNDSIRVHQWRLNNSWLWQKQLIIYIIPPHERMSYEHNADEN